MAANSNQASCTLSKFTIVAALAWFVFCAVGFSNAGLDILAFLLTVYAGGIWGLLWLGRFIYSLWRHRHSKIKPRCYWFFWLFEPAVVLLPLTLAFAGVFSDIRFALSEQALDTYVDDVRQGKVAWAFEFNTPPRQIGLYRVTRTDLLPDGTVRIITSGHKVMDKAGFAKSARRPPPKQGEGSYKPIHRQWWYWHESW
ncbi:MAG: hypothetical protein PHU14_04255 [Methylovulum sp.]|nr:hypothetical protein [Methylovulum sp.]